MSETFTSTTYNTKSDLNAEVSSWDEPRDIPVDVFEEENDLSCLDYTTKVLKVIVYVFGFLVVLSGAFLNQLSFVIIGAQMHLNEEKVRFYFFL